MRHRDPQPPISAALAAAGPDRVAREGVLASATARIGQAFDGIESYNSAYRAEPLTRAVSRFTKQHRVPLTLDTLVALAERINELSAIVEQSALTADDLPQAGWSTPGTLEAQAASLEARLAELASLATTGKGLLDPDVQVEGEDALEAASKLLAGEPSVPGVKLCDGCGTGGALSPGGLCPSCEFDGDECPTCGDTICSDCGYCSCAQHTHGCKSATLPLFEGDA